MHQISYKKRLILKVSTSVDGLRLKVSLLGNEIGKSSAKINYNVLREYVTGLTNGSISATQFQTNINRLNVATQIEASSILKLNSEMQQGLITEQQYKTGLIQISASLMNASAQTEQLSIKTRLLQSSLKLIGGLVNGIFSMGVSLLISGAISAMTKVINKHKEMIESTKNEVTSHKENAEKINDVVKAYSEYKDKITYTTEEKESLIKIQEQLVETYGSEAESIDLVNGKYDEQIEKLNKIKTDNLASVRNSAQSNFNEVSKDYDIGNFAKIDAGKFSQTSVMFDDEVYNQLGNEYEQFLQDINNIENISVGENIRNAHLVSTQIYNQSEDIEDNIKTWKQLQNVLRNYGLETSNLFNDVNSRYEKTSEKVNTYQESLKTLAQAEYDFYVSKNPFDETWNSEQVKKWEDNLLNQITDSRIQDELNSIIKNTVGKIAENEIEIVPFTYDKEKVQSAVDEANLIFSKVELDGETSKTTVFESLETIEKAMETLGKDGLIDTDSYDELLSIYPELEKVFVDTGKGYVASLSDIQKAEEDYIQSNKNIVEQSKPVIQEQMMSLVSEIAKAEVEQRNALAGGYDNKTGINDANNRLNNLKIQYRELSGILSELNEKQNSLNRDTELAYIQGMTGEISNLSSSVETLSGAFSEINTTGTMTSDTILKLVESGYASAIVYDENTHAATLNKQTLEELTKAKILATKVELQSKLTTAQNTSEIKAQIVALDMLYNNWDNIYNSGIEEETEKESETVTKTL